MKTETRKQKGDAVYMMSRDEGYTLEEATGTSLDL